MTITKKHTRSLVLCGLHFVPFVYLSVWLPLNQEPLNAFAGIDFTSVNVTLRIGRDHVQPVESAAGMAEEAEVTQCLSISPVHDPHDVVHDVGDIDEALIGTRKCQASGGS